MPYIVISHLSEIPLTQEGPAVQLSCIWDVMSYFHLQKIPVQLPLVSLHLKMMRSECVLSVI